MQAGRLRHKITIQQRVEVRDKDTKEMVTAWVDVAAVRASKEQLRGREYLEARQIQAELDTRFVIRYRAGITANMRVKHGDDHYEIVSPPIDPEHPARGRWLHLMCTGIK